LGGFATAGAQTKIGIVDMNRVFTEYSKTKDAQAKYSESEKAANDELNTRVETLKKSMEEINVLSAEAQKEGLSKEAADAKKKELQPKIDAARTLDKEIADYRTSKQKALQDQFLRMRKDIVEDIMKSVNDLVKAKGFDLVLDKSGLSSGAIPVVLYSRDDMDFSSEVLSALNKSAAAKPSK
jgi:Skp family chaperone for outer membrane proteins